MYFIKQNWKNRNMLIFSKSFRKEGKHPCFHDKRIRQKKERITVLMSRIVVGGGVFDEYGL